MARCNDCGKFVSYEGDEEPEVSGEKVIYDKEENSATVEFEVRRTLNCADCSTELKETTFNVETTFDLPEGEYNEEDFEEEISVNAADRSEGKGRYMKMFYGFDGEVTLKHDGETMGTESVSDYCQASHFEDCW